MRLMGPTGTYVTRVNQACSCLQAFVLLMDGAAILRFSVIRATS
jgi:hypothetical protein